MTSEGLYPQTGINIIPSITIPNVDWLILGAEIDHCWKHLEVWCQVVEKIHTEEYM